MSNHQITFDLANLSKFVQLTLSNQRPNLQHNTAQHNMGKGMAEGCAACAKWCLIIFNVLFCVSICVLWTVECCS